MFSNLWTVRIFSKLTEMYDHIKQRKAPTNQRKKTTMKKFFRLITSNTVGSVIFALLGVCNLIEWKLSIAGCCFAIAYLFLEVDNGK